MNLYKIFKPLIFKLDAEKAHNLAIKFLSLFPNLATNFVLNKKYENLKISVCDLTFASPLGMAAGFDKNAEILKALFGFGFGFVECGTVTPKPQIGNEKPRLFRLQKDNAIINRLGFNNKGAEIFLQNILFFKKYQQIQFANPSNAGAVLGINIGKNKDTKNALEDYLPLLEKFYQHASYLTVNISSPNTKNLRDLQESDQLDDFLKAIMDKKNELKNKFAKEVPIWLKIAPDLTQEQQEDIAKIALKNKIDALIISNTTIVRENLKSANANEIGGLSGQPLFEKSNQVLKNIYKLTNGQIPLIGVGGISSANDIYTKIKCGASLVQIYSMLIYQGFAAVEKMTQELSQLVKKDGFENISQAIGIDVM